MDLLWQLIRSFLELCDFDPTVVGVVKHCESCPVYCNQLVLLHTADRWDCKWEDSLGQGAWCRHDSVVVWVKDQAFIKVLAAKATNNHDSFS